MKKTFIYHSPSVEQIIRRGFIVKEVPLEGEETIEVSLPDPKDDYYQNLPLYELKGKKGNYFISTPRVTVVGEIEGDDLNIAVSRCSHLPNNEEHSSFPKSFEKRWSIENCKGRLQSKEFFKVIPTSSIPNEKSTEWFINMCKDIVLDLSYKPNHLNKKK